VKTCEEAADVVRALAGKWTLAVIAKLHERPMRHKQRENTAKKEINI